MADNFFTGGTMPSDDLLLYFNAGNELAIDNHWIVNGSHYGKTCDEWLARQDRNIDSVRRVLAATYGEGQDLKWHVFWRLFFLACSECFWYNGVCSITSSHPHTIL